MIQWIVVNDTIQSLINGYLFRPVRDAIWLIFVYFIAIIYVTIVKYSYAPKGQNILCLPQRETAYCRNTLLV
jgi:hypothetical protein